MAPFRTRAFLRFVFLLACLGLLTGLVAGFFGFAHPAFDTLAHFRWHFALGLLALAVCGLILRIRRAPLILLLFAVLGVWQSNAGNRTGFSADVEAAADQNLTATKANGMQLSMLVMNLRFDNPQRDGVIAMMLEQDADLLVLTETSNLWESSLNRLSADYPHRFHCPEWSRIGGSMIFSKLPLREVNSYCHDYAAIGIAEVELGADWVEIGAVHLRWPWPASGPAQIEAMRARLQDIGPDAVIAGDFNAATWSHSIAKFAEYGKLNVAKGFGGTWMYKWFPTSLAPALGLPIDNVMSKGRMRITGVRSLEPAGSDHLPLLVDLLWTGN